MSRQEFTKPVMAEIIKRATAANGEIYCEQCGLPTKRFDIDHTIADGLKIDKRRKLTADDGKLLCSGSRETCHGRKTALIDVPAIAKAKRNEAKDLRIPSTDRPGPRSLKAAPKERKPRDPFPTLPRRVCGFIVRD